MSLTPILVAGAGRSGTTALMQLLGSDPRVAFDRLYPFERRHLTYLAKFAGLAGRGRGGPHLDQGPLCDHTDAWLGPLPWPADPAPGPTAPPAVTAAEWLTDLWAAFSARTRRRVPGATHYAEKAPDWLPAAVRAAFPSRTLHLVRDPRDVFLSANAFNRARGWLAFGRRAEDTDLDHARTLARLLLHYFENQRTDAAGPDYLALRYEDLAADPETQAARLGRALDLELSAAAAGELLVPTHRTSADPSASVGRWRREPLPPEVRALLETQLDEALAFNGYERPGGARPPEALDLSRWDNVSADGTVAAAAEGGWSVTVTGDDFWVALEPASLVAGSVTEVWACVRGGTGGHCALYWRGRRQAFAEGRSVRAPYRPGGHWQVLRFPVGYHRGWRGTVAQLRLDLFNDGAEPGSTGELRWVQPVR